MITVTFAGCGDAFGSGGRFQACIHLRDDANRAPFLLDCGATSLTALRQAGSTSPSWNCHRASRRTWQASGPRRGKRATQAARRP